MRTPSLNLILALSILPMAAWSATPTPPVIAAPATTPATTRVGPKIQFASTVHDFGKISAGDVAKCEFVFTNASKALIIHTLLAK